jgi:hypothetical protein
MNQRTSNAELPTSNIQFFHRKDAKNTKKRFFTTKLAKSAKRGAERVFIHESLGFMETLEKKFLAQRRQGAKGKSGFFALRLGVLARVIFGFRPISVLKG